MLFDPEISELFEKFNGIYLKLQNTTTLLKAVKSKIEGITEDIKNKRCNILNIFKC